MDAWKQEFCDRLREGKTEAWLAAKVAGLPLAVVQGMRTEDPEFGQAWLDALDYINNKTEKRELTPVALEKVLAAQIPDMDAAAYFGLTHDEFKARIDADETLKRVHQLARPAGKAVLKLSQWDSALQGNWPAQQWLGKQELGQSESVAPQAPQTVINFNMTDPGASYRALLAGGTLELPTIEGEKVPMGVEDAITTDTDR